MKSALRSGALFILALSLSLSSLSTDARAEAETSRFSAGGYYRIMTRPDFDGGDSRLGLWNLYGRLLNEGPWGALELKLDLLQAAPQSQDVWTSVHAKIEGGSFANTDSGQGSMSGYRITHLYTRAGNLLLKNVTWQVGTLNTYFGDLGLYDMRPAELFWDTMGLSARYNDGPLEVLLGVGDAGYFLRGDRYSTVLTGGGYARLRLGSNLEVGAGGQYYHEPKVEGNRYAPHSTSLDAASANYEDYLRGEIVQSYDDAFPGQLQAFPNPTATDAKSWKLIAYMGFGGFGPIVWNNFFANYLRRHPESFITETYGGQSFDIYISDLSDERYEINAGNEMQIRLIPDLLDMAWGVLYGQHKNLDNTIAAGEDNRTFYSTVLRLQLYATPTTHFLLETSVAEEKITNGNLWREHYDSIFLSEEGTTNDRGLEFGDTDHRFTWQLKAGVVLNPLGPGLYTRPSLRLLWGLQYSNVHNAFGNNFVSTLAESNDFPETQDRHWHSVIAIEGEGWF